MDCNVILVDTLGTISLILSNIYGGIVLSKFTDALLKLKQLSEEVSGEPEAPSVLKSEMTFAEQIRALSTAYALLNEPVTIKPGDIIRGRRELAEGMIRDWEKPHILLELLPTPILLSLDSEKIADCSAAKRYDCVIGCLLIHPTRKGLFFLRYFADIREWELFPGVTSDKDGLS